MSGDAPTRSPLISADELRRPVERSPIGSGSSTAAGTSGGRATGARPTTAGHLPGAIHLDLDDDLADLAGYGAPGRHPLPSPAAFADRLGAGRDRRRAPRRRVRRRRWLGRRAAVVDARRPRPSRGRRPRRRHRGLDGGRRRADDGRACRGRRRRLHLADAWTGVISREELKARLGSVVLLDARAPARYRGETEPIDPGRRPHPDRPQRPGRRQPRRRPVPAGRPSWRRASRRSAPTARTGRSSPRAGAARRRSTTRSRCGSPACPTRSSTSARTATGPAPASRSRPAPTPVSRRASAGNARSTGPGHDAVMATRRRPQDIGAARARDLIALSGRELFASRSNSGLSQLLVSETAGMSRSTYGRIERGSEPGVSVASLCRLAAVLGLEVSLRFYPASDPVRDAGQLALIKRFRRCCHPSLRVTTEVPFPRTRRSARVGRGRHRVPVTRSDSRLRPRPGRPTSRRWIGSWR